MKIIEDLLNIYSDLLYHRIEPSILSIIFTIFSLISLVLCTIFLGISRLPVKEKIM